MHCRRDQALSQAATDFQVGLAEPWSMQTWSGGVCAQGLDLTEVGLALLSEGVAGAEPQLLLGTLQGCLMLHGLLGTLQFC
jgi:hypothetical protein